MKHKRALLSSMRVRRIHHCAWILVITLMIGSLDGQKSPHVISFFVRPLPAYPTPEQEKTVEHHKKQRTQDPDSVLTSIINKELNTNFLHSGIYISYAGVATRTNIDGQIVLERKTPDTKLNVIITEDLKPVPVDPLNDKTIYGFIVNPKAQVQQYQYELLQDPETEMYSWNVTEIPLPTKKRIPYDTIIIFANPKHIVVPVGSTATMTGENLVLPDMYVTPRHSASANALRFLKIRQYHAPVRFEYKFLPEQYQKIIRP